MEPILIPDFVPTALYTCDGDDTIYLFHPQSPSTATTAPCSENEVCPRTSLVRRVSESGVSATTITVAAKRPVAQICKGVKRQRVCFESKNHVHVFDSKVADGDGKQQLWYSRDELSEIKRSAKRACARQHDLEFALNNAYMHTGDATEFVKSAQQLINSPYFEEQRGLEHRTSQTLAFSRALTLLRVKTEIFVAQASRSLNQNVSCEDTETSLAKICAEVTEPALKYAQLLGLVDSVLANL